MSSFSEWIRGTVSKKLSFAGYEFTEATYAPGVKLSPHSHDCVYFRYVLEGDFTEFYGKKELLSGPSTVIFRSTDEIHSNHFHTKSRCFNIQVEPKHFDLISCGHERLSDTYVSRGGNPAYLIGRLYRELQTIDEFSGLTIEGLMLEIIAETLRQSAKKTFRNPPCWLLRVKESIDDEKFKQNITIKHLAKIAAVHPTHMAGEFRRYFGITIGDYVRLRRVEFARHKLITSNIPISEIALASGFYDQSHFTRVFKNIVGMTPAVYRNTFESH